MRRLIAATGRALGARSVSETTADTPQGVSEAFTGKQGVPAKRRKSSVPLAHAVTRYHFGNSNSTPAWRDVVVTLPLRLKNPLNGSWGHWAPKARERREQRTTVGLVCSAPLAEYRTGLAKAYIGRVVVTIERVAPRQLDDDNLRAACKAVRDGAADALEVDDREPRVEWRYEQSRGKPREYAVRIVVRGEA
jgi:hypothetical protein